MAVVVGTSGSGHAAAVLLRSVPDANLSAYMVASSEGKLVFINGADVTDPTSGTP